MNRNHGWVALVLIISGLTLSACGLGSSSAETTTGESSPITIEALQGKQTTRETLTEEAASRLGIETATSSDTEINGTKWMVVPYAAIIYDTEGATWVYTNPEPLTYIRHPVTVEDIQGDRAFLSDGPAAGTAVVTVGAEELYGAEFEFKEE